ncbi:MAG: glycosyl hydrolase 53 family protein [Clostridia bacterium]|nr:glycosyl hydrolase 53 family protein [Clostridia bacterium]
MKSKILKKILGFSVCGAMMMSVCPNTLAQNTYSGKITGLVPGYYNIEATYENSSVDGECYMWAKSSGSTTGMSALPKSTETSGQDIVVRSVYTADGEIEYGLYNDGTGDASISNVKAVSTSEYEFLNGGDISEYTIINDKGGKYYDLSGNEVNPIEYLASMGMNSCRIRLSNTPGKGHGDGTYYLPEGYQDEQDCLNLAKEAKANGMDIVFTFNYSDYWSNGERQRIPSDWVSEIKTKLGYDIESLSFLKSMTASQKSEIISALSDCVYNYTKSVMTKLKEQGTLPEYVSLGNEINGGMFMPFAGSFGAFFNTSTYGIEYESNDKNVWYDANFGALATILNRGYDAVKEVSDNKTQVIMHLASDGNFQYSNAGNHKWWYDAYKNAGGKWDVTGISYYPSWTVQTASVCKDRVNELSSLYDKPVMIMEVGYNWTDKKKDGYDGQLFNIDAYKEIYPDTQSGHKGFMAEFINYMKLSANCLGILYWDPLKIHVEDKYGNNLVGWAISENGDYVQSNVVENTTLFDFMGKAISSVGLYKETQNAIRTVELPKATTLYERGIDTAWSNADIEDWKLNGNSLAIPTINSTYGLYADNNMTGSVTKTFDVSDNALVTYETDFYVASSTGRTTNYAYIKLGDKLTIGYNGTYSMFYSLDGGATYSQNAIKTGCNGKTTSIKAVINSKTDTLVSLLVDGTEVLKDTELGEGSLGSVSMGFVRGGSVSWTVQYAIPKICVTQTLLSSDNVLEPTPQYKDKVKITQNTNDNVIAINVTPINGASMSAKDVILYVATYDDDGGLNDVVVKNGADNDGKIKVDATVPLGTHKLMLWDSSQTPIAKVAQ